MQQGLTLRAEIKTARQQFLDLLNTEGARTTDTMEAFSQDAENRDPIYTLLKRASHKLQQSPSLGTNILSLRKNRGTPIKTNPRTSLSASVKRKLSTDTCPQLTKVPKYGHKEQECLENELNENKENFLLMSTPCTPNKKSSNKKRRSSLKKLLTPKRRRSGSVEIPTPKMPRMGVRAKMVGATGSDLTPVLNMHASLPKKCTEPRMPAEGCDSKDSRDSAYQSTIASINDTYKTAELSSYHYSDSPSTCVLTDSTRTMRPILKDAIKQAAGEFMPSDTVKTTPCRKIEKPTKPMNRFNVSELLSESDFTTLSKPDRTEANDETKGGNNNDTSFPGDISKLSFITQSHTTMREQTSEINLVVPGAMHSTFNYPLHSTMNYPLSSTINNLQCQPDMSESPEDISDCDSSVLSLDVDDLSFNFDEENMGGCDVCKVVGLRRQMAQPKLEKRRRPPVGLSETEIDFEARFPMGRLPPVGASQSILEADNTLVSCSNNTLNVTVGSLPNMSSLTELDDTVVPNEGSKRHSTASSNTLKGSVHSSSSSNSSRKTKKHKRSSKVFVLGLEGEDKENVNFFTRGHEDPKRKALRSKSELEQMKAPMYPDYSSDYSTLSATTLDSSHKQLLKQRMRSFNASQKSMNSSSVTTLGFL